MSCTDIFFPPEPSNTPEDNFEIFWNDFDRYYPFFEYKHLQWDSIYRVKRPLITPATSDAELFTHLDDMIQYLRDGHADLQTGTSQSFFDFAGKYPANQLAAVPSYVTLRVKNKKLSYGMIGSDIGYLFIRSFGGTQPEFDQVDAILRELKSHPLKGLIVDIRGNGGGSDTYSRQVAGRFADRASVYSYVRYKAGPAHNAFGEWIPKSIEPGGEHFPGKVVVLTNRRVFSAAEDFLLAMRELPTVTVVGDTTGGGSGNPLQRFLPNGWRFRVPRWQQVDVRFVHYEGIGLYPDIPIWISPDDFAAGRDTILETAIEELRK